VRTQNKIRINQLFTPQFPQQQNCSIDQTDAFFAQGADAYNRVKLRSDLICFVSARLKVGGQEIQFGAALA
jgi:hypothetical protein